MAGKQLPLCTISCIAMLALAAQGYGALLQDDFGGNTLNASLWNTAGSAGTSTTALVDGSGHLVAQVSIPNGSHRALAVSKANNFDAFSAPLQITLSGISVGGEAATGTNVAGYVLFGRSNDDTTGYYFPNGNFMSDGFGVTIRKDASSGYNLLINQFSSTLADASAAVALTGAPTGMVLLVDGTSKSLKITVEGATFAATGELSYVYQLNSSFSAESLTVAGSLLTRLAIGAMNLGNVTTGASLTVDSVNVSAVPEPATLGLGLLGLPLLMMRRR